MSGQLRGDIPAQVRPGEVPTGPAGGRAPIGRGEHARARVLRAALAILASDGLSGLTMEAVARRAGASKGTLYRRWSSRAALLVDAMSTTFVPMTPPATGELRADLLGLVRSGQELLDRQPFARLMAAVIDAAERDVSLGSLHTELTERRRQPFHQVLTEAMRRGEIAPDTDIELATDLLVGPIFYRRFIAHLPFPDRYAEAIVDGVLSAIGPSEPGMDTSVQTGRLIRPSSKGDRHPGSAETERT
jgi:AcrR family transcriptional regulator